ncbi:MAG: hypothetical protein NVS3B21_34310 [Acidimicrobiales bacterium]
MSAYWLTLTDAVDPDWWKPLVDLAGAVEGTGLPAVDPDDFAYAARLDRKGLATVHIYRNLHTRKCLNIDEAGGLWRYVGAGGGIEGYTQVPDAAEALERAEVARGNLLAAHTRTKCEDAWLTATVGAGKAPARSPNV